MPSKPSGGELKTDDAQKKGSEDTAPGERIESKAASSSAPSPSETERFNVLLVGTSKEDSIKFLKDYLKYHRSSKGAETRLLNLKEGKDELYERPVEEKAAVEAPTMEKEHSKSKSESMKKEKSAKDMSRKKSKSIKRKDSEKDGGGQAVKASA